MPKYKVKMSHFVRMKLKSIGTLCIAYNKKKLCSDKMTGVRSQKMKWFVQEHISSPRRTTLWESPTSLHVRQLQWNALHLCEMHYNCIYITSLAQVQFHNSYLQCTLPKDSKGVRTIRADIGELALVLWALNKKLHNTNFISQLTCTRQSDCHKDSLKSFSACHNISLQYQTKWKAP